MNVNYIYIYIYRPKKKVQNIYCSWNGISFGRWPLFYYGYHESNSKILRPKKTPKSRRIITQFIIRRAKIELIMHMQIKLG